MAAREHPATKLTRALAFVARHGRWCLVLGLLAGLTLPAVANALRPWLPHLIAALLFVSAYRIGPRAAIGSLTDLRQATLRILVYQLAAPLLLIASLTAFGVLVTAPALAAVLVLSAPSVTGAPNFTILMGRDPTSAMRLLLLGTALFPLTVIPVFLALPVLPTIGAVLLGAGKLLLVIGIAVGAAFTLRSSTLLKDEPRAALDGLAAILLGIVVIGLMSAAGPTLREAPFSFALWLTFTLALNFGLQTAAWFLYPDTNAGQAIVAGNRNIALFLVALPPEVVNDLLLFIACYQVPMYLTPFVMRRLYLSRTEP